MTDLQTANPQPAETTDFPSLDTVRKELDAVTASQEKRVASTDTRAGLVLGFSGVIAGFVKDAQNWVSLGGQVVAVAAGILAIAAFLPRTGLEIDPRPLAEKYAKRTPGETTMAVLVTRLHLYGEEESALRRKVMRLRSATVMLALAISVIIVGSALRLMGLV